MVYPELHDLYPQIDLDGQFMGDGFLQCDAVGSCLSMNTDAYHGEMWEDGVSNITQGEHSLRWFL